MKESRLALPTGSFETPATNEPIPIPAMLTIASMPDFSPPAGKVQATTDRELLLTTGMFYDILCHDGRSYQRAQFRDQDGRLGFWANTYCLASLAEVDLYRVADSTTTC